MNTFILICQIDTQAKVSSSFTFLISAAVGEKVEINDDNTAEQKYFDLFLVKT